MMKDLARETVNLLPAKWERELYWFKNRMSRARAIRKWEINGKPSPPPHQYKQFVVRSTAKKKGLKNFVETGTFRGKMIESQRKTFKNLYSIELDVFLYNNPRKYFVPFSHVQLFQGDSATVLTAVLKSIKQPILFWLDGHYCGEGTGMSDVECPVLAELKTIFENFIVGSYILIDDARLFIGKNDYPTIEEIGNFIKSNNVQLKVFVLNDIVHIH